MSDPAALLANVEALFVDCDGVLTTGEITYDENGVRSSSFYSRDGLGLAILSRAGIAVAVISGRPTDVAERRHRELGVQHFIGSCRDKAAAVRDLCAELGIDPAATAFVGDDIVDLAGFAASGIGIAVADAAPEVREAADWVTTAPGGRGAVREVCEAILRGRGVWPKIVAKLGGA